MWTADSLDASLLSGTEVREVLIPSKVKDSVCTSDKSCWMVEDLT